MKKIYNLQFHLKIIHYYSEYNADKKTYFVIFALNIISFLNKDPFRQQFYAY